MQQRGVRPGTRRLACLAAFEGRRLLLTLLLCLLGLPVFMVAMACAPLPSDDPIDKEKNRDVLLAVWDGFDPVHREALQDIPLLLQPGTRTALAHTSVYVQMPYDYPYIALSPDWDHRAEQSPFWEALRERGTDPAAPVFADSFKRELLSHEYLHMLQNDLGIEMESFFNLVQSWYPDPAYGVPAPAGNRIKYILWWNLFKQADQQELDANWRQMQYKGQYSDSTPGVEEFAYIGSQIIMESDPRARTLRLKELSPELRGVYRGILAPELLEMD